MFLNNGFKLFQRGYSSMKNGTGQICIIGSGPAGFYFAQHILKVLPGIQVDIYEKLPIPFGLVRFGVAPDHPEVKNVINSFSKTAKLKNCRFVGNVTLGKDVSIKDLKEAYHAIVLAYGCSEDSTLEIPGENLENVISARRFVGWYNGLPGDIDLKPNLDFDTAVILGQGNVAIDVARILLTPIDMLKKTDITSYSLEGLKNNNIKKVYLVGRRGPLHVAFTIKEFREMTKLPNVRIAFRKEQLSGLEEYLPNLPRVRRRLTDLILTTSKKEQFGTKIFFPLFLRKPIEITGKSQVEGVKFNVNQIKDNLKGEVVTTTEVDELTCGLVFRSIGYKGTCPDEEIKFDQAVSRAISDNAIYCTGWIGTGPVGVIISTMNNAFAQAEKLANDIKSNYIDVTKSKPGYTSVKKILQEKGVVTVDFPGWEKIDKVETERGQKEGKPREKIVDVVEMLKIGGEL